MIKEPLVSIGFQIVLHDDLFPQTAEDEEWIPYAVEKGWAALTSDKRIHMPLQRRIIIETGLRYFCLSTKNADTETRVRVLKKHYNTIVAIDAYLPGPFIASMTLQDLKVQWLGDIASISE